MHSTSPSGIPIPVLKIANGKIVTGSTPPNTPRQATWITDAHFHATNYTQQGYGELHLEGSTASLCLWIGCDFRGRGFGTRLVKALCSLARANGLQRVLSAAFADNLHSLRALRAAGFVEFEAEGFDRTCRHLVWTPHSLTPHEAQQHLVEFCRRRDRRRLHG